MYPEGVWALGKEGWYLARWGWNESYARHLITLGYTVRRNKDTQLDLN